MDAQKNYKELDVWKQAIDLVKLVYELTKRFPNDELYGLTNQMRRCSVSVPSNIAEGIGRQYPKDIVHFLYIARGSLYELETQFYISCELGYIKKEILDDHLAQVTRCKQLTKGLINYYQSLIN